MNEPRRRLSGTELASLGFVARRQLALWSNKPRLSPNQQAQRNALTRAVHVLQEEALTGGCELHSSTGEKQADACRLAQDRARAFESADGQWRIANPWKLTTELRHRWLVAERRASGSGWCMHDGDHATLHDARAYVEDVTG